MPHAPCADDGAAAEEAFSRAQRRTLMLIQESRALLDVVCAAHASGRFELLYPDGACEAGTLRDSNTHSRHSRSASRGGVRRGDLRVLALPSDVGGGSREAQTVLGQMLCARLSECAAHMDRLHARVCERTSRVLVTGDVNAGKSTFVNALLRRALLPMDQQPCTQSFCEVVPVASNAPCTVHAITCLDAYRAEDAKSYDALSLSEMQTLVQDEDTAYQAFRVHLPASRGLFGGSSPSLASLANGGLTSDAETSPENPSVMSAGNSDGVQVGDSALDVSVIDSPGLNSDLAKTLALFAKQDDIDVVVFVVNAANHLTLSARDFLEAAGREKALVFVIVNRFDEIRNRERCVRVVLEQVRGVLPRTHDLRDSLVHFISARHALNARNEGQCQGALCEISLAPASTGNATTEAISHTDCEYCSSFSRVERALHEFLLQRRTDAKLEPAQTFVANVLAELDAVIVHTRDRRAAELTAVSHELGVIAPCHDELVAAQGPLRADVRRVTDECASIIAQDVFDRLGSVNAAYHACAVPWNGILHVGDFMTACNASADAALDACWSSCLLAAASSVSKGHHELHAAACAYARHVYESGESADTEMFFDAAAIRAALAMPGPRLPIIRFGGWDAVRALWTAIVKRAAHLSAIAGASAVLAATRNIGTVHAFARLFLLMPRPQGGRVTAITSAALAVGATALILRFLGQESEEALRTHVRQHFETHESNDGWRRDASVRLGRTAESLLAEHRDSLIARFDAALHRQRELRASKDVQRAQIDAALQYLDGRRLAIRSLLRHPSTFNQ